MSQAVVFSDLEARESQRQRELEEARARAVQMEKTMKWWSDCTANWREKWSKVRNERNKAREEAKQLRSNLDIAMKEANTYKREKNDLEIQITQLKTEMEKVHTLMMKHAGQFHKTGMNDGTDDGETNGHDANCSPDISSDGLKNVNSEDGLVTKIENPDINDRDVEEYVVKGAMPKNLSEIDSVAAEEKRLIQQLSKDDFDEEYLLQKITMLQLRLDEAQTTVQAERDEKNILHKSVEKLTLDMQEVRDRHEELRSAKQEAVRELLTLQEQHRAEMRIINNSLQEEIGSRENLERRLSELRTELERLQAENALEWGKRERLETEKLALERDNKKLRAEIRDFQERSDRKGRHPLQASDAEVRVLQQELADRNKENNDVKLSHSKLKKILAETNTELGHAVRRAEQYESEVKRLRQRVEELKRELAGAEDELDSAVNQVRRLQRTNDDLVGQAEGLQVQIQHLQIRRAPSPQMRICSIGGVQLRNKVATDFPSDCLPNINDLRQIFDDTQTLGTRTESNSKRSSHTERTLLQQQQFNSAFFDAKTSHAEENIFESKSRNLEFERAKQKFDNPTNLQCQNQQHHQRERSSVRFGAGVVGSSGNQQAIDRTNLALPLKVSNNSGGNTNGNILLYTKASHTHSNSVININQEESNRSTLFEDRSRSSTVGGGAGISSIVGSAKKDNNTIGNDSCGGSGYARNSINLDGLKVSDDETP